MPASQKVDPSRQGVNFGWDPAEEFERYSPVDGSITCTISQVSDGMDLKIRGQRLQAAGLSVLDSAWNGDVPSPIEAWRVVIGGSVKPSMKIRINESGEHLAEVQVSWERYAEEADVFGAGGEFLISVAGVGAASAPWARVRRESGMQLAQVLA